MNTIVSNNGATSMPNQEFSIRVPKFDKRKFSILRFNSDDMDFSKLGPVSIQRENNRIEQARADELPKYGAGSEYLREEKEEARRKRRFGKKKDYNPSDQPWILKLGRKDEKKYRGVREGGVNENTSYYIFMQSTDGSIEAFPVSEWYNFQAINRFKALTAEEAEQEFGKRDKSFNFFNVMMRKRFHNEEEEQEKENKNTRTAKKDFKISEMDDWIDTEDDEDAESENGVDEKKQVDQRKKKEYAKKQATKKNDSDGSAFEESDDGDEEGREPDYISDSSLSISDTEANDELKGVSDENALRNLLESDEDEEEENKSLEEGFGDDMESEETATATVSSSSTPELKKGKKRTNDGKIVSSDNSSEIGAESSESENLESTNDTNFPEPGLKKTKSDSSITEEAIRRYLTRKPMTAKQLLQKIKKSKPNISSNQLVPEISDILKRINPRKQIIQNQMYLSLIPGNTHH